MLVRWPRALRVIAFAICCGGLIFFYQAAFHAPSMAQIASSTASSPTATPAATASAPIPASLETPKAVQAGAHLFRENCVQCHGAPGVGAIVQGLTPAPPNLLAAGRRNDPAEVFLKVKNGIAGTAMPAFGNVLSEEGRWSLAAFLHHSRGISPDAFDALSR